MNDLGTIINRLALFFSIKLTIQSFLIFKFLELTIKMTIRLFKWIGVDMKDVAKIGCAIILAKFILALIPIVIFIIITTIALING